MSTAADMAVIDNEIDNLYNLFDANTDDRRDYQAYSENTEQPGLAQVWFLLKIVDEKIISVKWLGEGTRLSLGFCSMVSKYATNKSITEAMGVSITKLNEMYGITTPSQWEIYAAPAMSALYNVCDMYLKGVNFK